MPRPNVTQQRIPEILQAAALTFNEQGLAMTRMEDIAKAAGVSKGTIYLYFPSKEALIEALVRQMFAPLDEALHRLRTSDVPAAHRLLSYSRETIAIFVGAQSLHPLLLEVFALTRRQPFAQALLHDYFTTYRDSLIAIIEEGVERGELQVTNAREVALRFITTLDGLLFAVMITPDLLDLERDGVQVMEAVITSITIDQLQS